MRKLFAFKLDPLSDSKPAIPGHGDDCMPFTQYAGVQKRISTNPKNVVVAREAMQSRCDRQSLYSPNMRGSPLFQRSKVVVPTAQWFQCRWSMGIE